MVTSTQLCGSLEFFLVAEFCACLAVRKEHDLAQTSSYFLWYCLVVNGLVSDIGMGGECSTTTRHCFGSMQWTCQEANTLPTQ